MGDALADFEEWQRSLLIACLGMTEVEIAGIIAAAAIALREKTTLATAIDGLDAAAAKLRELDAEKPLP